MGVWGSPAEGLGLPHLSAPAALRNLLLLLLTVSPGARPVNILHRYTLTRTHTHRLVLIQTHIDKHTQIHTFPDSYSTQIHMLTYSHTLFSLSLSPSPSFSPPSLCLCLCLSVCLSLSSLSHLSTLTLIKYVNDGLL